ncbi:hypothetical protein QQ045_031723 [Rhodiola kirilowii]
MPRKLSYNIDYDDIWDEEDDYANEEYLEDEDNSKSYDQTKGFKMDEREGNLHIFIK